MQINGKLLCQKLLSSDFIVKIGKSKSVLLKFGWRFLQLQFIRENPHSNTYIEILFTSLATKISCVIKGMAIFRNGIIEPYFFWIASLRKSVSAVERFWCFFKRMWNILKYLDDLSYLRVERIETNRVPWKSAKKPAAPVLIIYCARRIFMGFLNHRLRELTSSPSYRPRGSDMGMTSET